MSKRDTPHGPARRTALAVSWLAALTLTLAVSPAEPAASQSEDPAPASSQERDDLVCKRERVIGSHIRKRTCRTRAQIEAEREATQKAIEDLSKTRGPNGDGG